MPNDLRRMSEVHRGLDVVLYPVRYSMSRPVLSGAAFDFQAMRIVFHDVAVFRRLSVYYDSVAGGANFLAVLIRREQPIQGLQDIFTNSGWNFPTVAAWQTRKGFGIDFTGDDRNIANNTALRRRVASFMPGESLRIQPYVDNFAGTITNVSINLIMDEAQPKTVQRI